MRAQVWTEILIAVSGVFLGVLLVVAPLFTHLEDAKAVRSVPVLTLAEVFLEQNKLVPFSVELFEVNDGNLYVRVFPSSDELAEEMKSLGGAEVRSK